MSESKLVLLDIDWTLLKGRIPAHINSFEYGFKKVYGITATINDAAPYEGKIERQIILEILQNKGFGRDVIEARLAEMLRAMAEFVKKNIKKGDVVVLPGVKDFLNAMKNRGYKLGVLTGNIRDIARTKLNLAGIDAFFDIGAYGDETEERFRLVDIAKKRANEKFGVEFKNSDIYLIGDSIRDIQCGKKAGVRTIGVTTGNYKRQDLEREKADLVVTSLEFEKIREFIEK